MIRKDTRNDLFSPLALESLSAPPSLTLNSSCHFTRDGQWTTCIYMPMVIPPFSASDPNAHVSNPEFIVCAMQGRMLVPVESSCYSWNRCWSSPPANETRNLFPHPQKDWFKKKKKSYKWKNSFSYTQILFFFLSTWQEDPTFSQKNTENYLGKLDDSLGEKSHQLSKEVVMFCFPIFLIVWIFKSFLPKTQPKSMYLFSRLRNMEASLNFAKRRQLFARPKVYTDSFMQIHLSTPVAKYLSVIAACLFKWWGNIKYHTFSAETGQ